MGSLLTALGLPPKTTVPAGMAARVGTPKAVDAARAAYVPSPEAKAFNERLRATLARIEALKATHPDEAKAMRADAAKAGALGHHTKTRAQGTADIKAIGVRIDQLLRAEAEAKAKAGSAPKGGGHSFSVGARTWQGLDAAKAREVLQRAVAAADERMKGAFEEHCRELQIQREEPFAAWVSGGISKLKAFAKGGKAVDIDDLTIWDPPQKALNDARAALKGGEFERCAALLGEVEKGRDAASGKVKKHNADAIESAGQAVEGARKIQDTTIDIAGTAAKELGGDAAEIAVKGGLRGVYNAAEQLSAVHIAQIQKEIDWKVVAKETAAQVVSDLVGLLLKGPMAERFSGLFGPYLKKAHFSDAELAALAKAVGATPPLDRDFLMTRAQRYVKDFLLEKGQAFITSAVADAIKGKKPEDPPMPIDELMASTAQGAITDKLIAAFVAFVVKQAKK